MKRILQAEFLSQARSQTRLLLFATACILLLASAYSHWHQQSVLSAAQAQWQQEVDALWAEQPDRHPHRVAHYGHVVVRPQAPLAFIEPGVGPYVGNYLFLEAHRQNSSAVRATALNPVLLKLAYPSMGSILIIMWPLLLIVLGYGAFSRDWESGRLYWLSSLGAKVWPLFLAKALVLGSYSLILLLLVGGSGAALLYASGNFSSANLWDLFTLLSLYALYSLLWIVLVLSFSWYSRSSQQSLWRLLTLWIFMALILPKAANSIAESIYPVPARANFEAAVEEAAHAVGDSHNPDDPHFAAFKTKVLQQYAVDNIADLPVNWNGLVMAEGERISSEIFQTHHQQVLDQFAAQDALRNLFAVLSPTLAAEQLSQRLAHTDRETSWQFDQAAEAFRYALIQKLNQLHSHNIKREHDREQKVSAAEWRKMALFEYQPDYVFSLPALQWAGLAVWLACIAFLVGKFKSREIYR